jgi:hypothetical protein
MVRPVINLLTTEIVFMNSFKMKEMKRAQQTQTRINDIKIELWMQRENLELMVESYKNIQLIKSEPFKPRVIKYTSLPKSEKYYQWAIQHCKFEIKLLEKELDTLIQYGAIYEN